MGQKMVNLLLVIRRAGPLPTSLNVLHLPSARRDPVQAHTASLLPLPSTSVWLPGRLQGQGDGLAVRAGGLFWGWSAHHPPFPSLCLLWSGGVLERFHGWWCWDKLPGYKQLQSVFISHPPQLNFGRHSSVADWGNTKLSCLFQFAGWFTTKSLVFPTTSFCITSNDGCIPEQWLVVCRNSWCWIMSWIILLCSIMRKEGFPPHPAMCNCYQKC